MMDSLLSDDIERWWTGKEFAPSQNKREFYRLLGSLMPGLSVMVSVTGFEPVLSWSQATRFAKLSYTLKDGGLYGN